jgi:hypothetical protein
MSKSASEFFQSLNPMLMRPDAGKFAAKLSHSERCAVLACLINGVSHRVLAQAFGINRRTVSHIGNRDSIHYKSVRDELIGLGKEAFTDKYITEDIQNRVDEAGHSAIVRMTNDAAARQDANIRTPTKMRNKHRGTHVLTPEQCKYSHRVEIGWVNGFLGEGWYYRDLDGPEPEKWFHCGPESILSSTAALREAEMAIFDI